MLDFKIIIDKESRPPVLRVNGEIDIYTMPKLNDAFKEVLAYNNASLILNLENVQYIDSTGLGTIAQGARALSINGGTLNIVCTKPQIRKIFEVSGLNKKNIVLYDNEKDAFAVIE